MNFKVGELRWHGDRSRRGDGQHGLCQITGVTTRDSSRVQYILLPQFRVTEFDAKETGCVDPSSHFVVDLTEEEIVRVLLTTDYPEWLRDKYGDKV